MLSGVITLQWCKLEKHFLLLAVYITCALGFMENKFFVKTTWNPNPDTTLAQEWCPKSSSHSACVHTNATQGQGWCVWSSWVKSRTRGPPKKNLTNRGEKKAVALNCLSCSSGCPACVSSQDHTSYTHGSGTCSASSGRGSKGICSKPFINHALTAPRGFGQCWSPACCREERLKRQHPWEQVSAMLGLRV